MYLIYVHICDMGKYVLQEAALSNSEYCLLKILIITIQTII